MDNAMRDIINAAREYGFFVDRGDPAAVDFVSSDLFQNNAWHELDLSAIVPTNAHCVLLGIIIQAAIIDKYINIRKAGNVNNRNISSLRIQVANIRISGDISCPISADRKIEYQISIPVWTRIFITVKGWWF